MVVSKASIRAKKRTNGYNTVMDSNPEQKEGLQNVGVRDARAIVLGNHKSGEITKVEQYSLRLFDEFDSWPFGLSASFLLAAISFPLCSLIFSTKVPIFWLGLAIYGAIGFSGGVISLILFSFLSRFGFPTFVKTSLSIWAPAIAALTFCQSVNFMLGPLFAIQLCALAEAIGGASALAVVFFEKKLRKKFECLSNSESLHTIERVSRS